PTRGGSSDSVTTGPIVSPNRSPSTSTVTTATPEGNDRTRPRSSPARSTILAELLREQPARERVPRELAVAEELLQSRRHERKVNRHDGERPKPRLQRGVALLVRELHG